MELQQAPAFGFVSHVMLMENAEWDIHGKPSAGDKVFAGQGNTLPTKNWLHFLETSCLVVSVVVRTNLGHLEAYHMLPCRPEPIPILLTGDTVSSFVPLFGLKDPCYPTLHDVGGNDCW